MPGGKVKLTHFVPCFHLFLCRKLKINQNKWEHWHYMKSVQIQSFSSPYFPAFKQRDTKYLSAFSPNLRKYEMEKLQIRTLFTHVKRNGLS